MQDSIPQRTDSLPLHAPVDLPPRMRTRQMYIRRMEVETYGPARGCPGCQKVMSGAVPSCIAATHNDESRERVEKLMMQDPEGPDLVARTKTRIDEPLARHMEEHDERARQESGTSSSSSGVIRLRKEQQRESGRCENERGRSWTSGRQD